MNIIAARADRDQDDMPTLIDAIGHLHSSESRAPTTGKVSMDFVAQCAEFSHQAIEAFWREPYDKRELKFRSFRNGDQSFELDEAWLEAPEPPLEAIRNADPDVPYGLILYDMQNWSADLDRMRLQLLRADAEFASAALEYRAALIVGNHGYTPLGIHVDDGERSVLHLPIEGPAKKSFLVLDQQRFEKLAGHKRATYHFDRYVKDFDRYELDQGDFFYFHGDWLHTTFYRDYSLSLMFIRKKYVGGAVVAKCMSDAALRSAVLDELASRRAAHTTDENTLVSACVAVFQRQQNRPAQCS